MSDPQQPLIRLAAVTKVFQTREVETRAVSDLDLTIERGEYLAISGPSGCGKSTLLSLLGLLDTPTSGTYLLEGTPVHTLDLTERARIRNRQIGFVFQSFNLIGDMDVFRNVELPLAYRGLRAGERRERVMDTLRRVGLENRAKHMPNQLSGGQQQRVAVARAVVGRPSILLADEPTGNLDSTHGEAVMDLLRSLHEEGSTLCMVTHDPRFAQGCDRNVRLLDGRAVETSTARHGRSEGVAS
jgi:putative ABC transport system ATP-binding protein